MEDDQEVDWGDWGANELSSASEGEAHTLSHTHAGATTVTDTFPTEGRGDTSLRPFFGPGQLIWRFDEACPLEVLRQCQQTGLPASHWAVAGSGVALRPESKSVVATRAGFLQVEELGRENGGIVGAKGEEVGSEGLAGTLGDAGEGGEKITDSDMRPKVLYSISRCDGSQKSLLRKKNLGVEGRVSCHVVPKVGDLVYARVLRVSSRQVVCDILDAASITSHYQGDKEIREALEASRTGGSANEDRRTAFEVFWRLKAICRGKIRQQDIIPTGIDFIALIDCFKPSDIIRARVVR